MATAAMLGTQNSHSNAKCNASGVAVGFIILRAPLHLHSGFVEPLSLCFCRHIVKSNPATTKRGAKPFICHPRSVHCKQRLRGRLAVYRRLSQPRLTEYSGHHSEHVAFCADIVVPALIIAPPFFIRSVHASFAVLLVLYEVCCAALVSEKVIYFAFTDSNSLALDGALVLLYGVGTEMIDLVLSVFLISLFVSRMNRVTVDFHDASWTARARDSTRSRRCCAM